MVLRLARENGLEIEIREVTFDELLDADEVFITASNKKIMPVKKIDETPIVGPIPGQVTLRLMRLFDDYIKNPEGWVDEAPGPYRTLFEGGLETVGSDGP